jgi:hypothetical protein
MAGIVNNIKAKVEGVLHKDKTHGKSHHPAYVLDVFGAAV